MAEREGVRVKVVAPRERFISADDLIAAMTPRTRVISVSLVRYNDGSLLEAPRVAAACREQGALLLLDVSQCCGAMPMDPQCAELNRVTEQRSTANQVAVIGAVATGVSAAAFLGAWLFWPKSSAGNIGSSLVLPHLSADRAGIDVIGVLE